MSDRKIQAFFNGERQGDTFQGLNDSIQGRNAGRIIATLPEFLKEAGRDYCIRKVPARVTDPFGGIDASGAIVPMDRDVEGQFHLMRGSDGQVVSPHTVSGQYGPLSLVDLSEELNPWVSEGWATPDGVYSTDDGSVEVLSLRLDAGDVANMTPEFRHYAILENPHARGGKAKGKIISWRIVCANTFAMAIGAASDFTVGHRMANGDPETQSAIMRDRAKLKIQAWENLQTHVRTLAQRIDVLKSVPLGFKDAENLTEKLLGIDGVPVEDRSKRSENRKDAILAGFKFPQFGTFGESAYDWLNAVTFDTSSPFAPQNQKSKVSGMDRMLRNIDSTGVGYGIEAKANSLLETLVR
jgi:hypothetical protein